MPCPILASLFTIALLLFLPGVHPSRLSVTFNATRSAPGGVGARRQLPSPVQRHSAGHRRPFSAFDLCVANRENGEPGSYSYSTVHWHAVNEYFGAYSFLHSTWVAAGGLRYAYNANEASPTEQSAVFNHWSRVDPGAWPNTLPACE